METLATIVQMVAHLASTVGVIYAIMTYHRGDRGKTEGPTDQQVDEAPSDGEETDS